MAFERWLFGWEQLVFLIPVAVGSLLALGAALGLAGDGAGDTDADHPDPGAALAAGRVPLVLRAMLVTLSFGGLGLIASYLLGAPEERTGGRTMLAVALAMSGSWYVSRRLGRLLARRAPLLESEAIDRRDLVGSVGRAVLAIGPAGGTAQVLDRRGNLHQVACQTLPGEQGQRPGGQILIIDYDDRTRRYLVAPADG